MPGFCAIELHFNRMRRDSEAANGCYRIQRQQNDAFWMQRQLMTQNYKEGIIQHCKVVTTRCRHLLYPDHAIKTIKLNGYDIVILIFAAPSAHLHVRPPSRTSTITYVHLHVPSFILTPDHLHARSFFTYILRMRSQSRSIKFILSLIFFQNV